MSSRLPNPRLAKIHLSYTVEEAARLYKKQRGTVRNWIKGGLPVLKSKRPHLILGHDLRAFLEGKRKANRQPCHPGQLRCMRCRLPQYPAGNIADYVPSSTGGGQLVGICPDCDSLMYQQVGLARLEAAKLKLEITMPMAHPRIADTP